MDVAVVILAHNHAETVAETVSAALAVRGVTRAVVVDDGSEDDTGDIAQLAGAKVVRMFGHAGRGGALKAGAKRVDDADVVVVLDGDLGATATQAALLIEPVLAGVADMAIATLRQDDRGVGDLRIANLARWGIARYGGPLHIDDPLSGQRAFTRQCFTTLRPFSPGYGVEVGLTIRALRAGFRLAQVPTTMVHAEAERGMAGFLRLGRELVHVAIALTRLSREPSPVRSGDDDWR